MPPKKKGGGKGGKKDGGGYIVDGVSTTEMTHEQLQEFAQRLKEEIDREREERNYFQLERDKLQTFWEITRQQLEETRAELRNKDREIEEAEEKHQTEIKIYKQKVKHLLYEHQNNLAEYKAESMVSLRMAQDDYTDQEMELLADKKDLKSRLRDQELAHQEEMRNVKLEHSEALSKAREKFESEAREIEAKYERKLVTQRNDICMKYDMELKELEERKNKHITELMKNHEKAFSEIKSYYNDITLNNLTLIASLKEQMEETKEHEDRMEKELRELKNENKRLVQPFEEAQATVADLTRKMQTCEKDKESLMISKARLKLCLKELEDLKWENEVLKLRFDKLQHERDEIHHRFVTAIMELQQKTGLKNVLLEKKLSAITGMLEQKEAELGEILSAANLDPTTVGAINKKFEELLKRKNAKIQDLQYELSRVCKAHDDLLETYEGKLRKYGIPTEELGFTPLRATRQRHQVAA
ncbi:dynein regulatory complex subunit 4 [Schistocerca cancellata]|uniref:dynein regulatory complex subunit 4 n=1 Tax=Schistocerca cancellata TaxID=274614 RepID=UPI0021199CC0|nr:dynein regulatory complex subunit 4 [Schistocerca cancellata]